MVDEIVPPLRSEPLLQQGTNVPTTRYAEYLEEQTSTVNNLVVSEEEILGIQTEIQQVQSFTAEIDKDVDRVDQATIQINQMNARLTEAIKLIDDLNQLIGNNNANAQIAELSKRIDDVEALV